MSDDTARQRVEEIERWIADIEPAMRHDLIHLSPPELKEIKWMVAHIAQLTAKLKSLRDKARPIKVFLELSDSVLGNAASDDLLQINHNDKFVGYLYLGRFRALAAELEE